MTLHAALLAAIEAIRPGTDAAHAERIIRNATADLKRELRWLDIYEGIETRGKQ